MNIIFGTSRDDFPDSHTILELDQFKIGDSPNIVTAYCLVENVPFGDFPTLNAYIKVHHDLMEQYRARNWEYCADAIKGLTGRWNGELDSFYNDLKERVEYLTQNPPGDDWDGIILK